MFASAKGQCNSGSCLACVVSLFVQSALASSGGSGLSVLYGNVVLDYCREVNRLLNNMTLQL